MTIINCNYDTTSELGRITFMHYYISKNVIKSCYISQMLPEIYVEYFGLI